MTIAAPHIPEPPLTPERLTVEQYHQMIAQGILEEGSPIELLDGLLVRKDRSAIGGNPMTVGAYHFWVVNQLADLNSEFRTQGCFIQTQQPVSIAPVSEPEPDGAIILGNSEDFKLHKPAVKEILAVIEVADSSLHRDRTTKLRIYAASEIPLYFIINLPEKVIERYSQPLASASRYGQSETLSIRQTVAFPTAGSPLKIAVRKLIP